MANTEDYQTAEAEIEKETTQLIAKYCKIVRAAWKAKYPLLTLTDDRLDAMVMHLMALEILELRNS